MQDSAVSPDQPPTFEAARAGDVIFKSRTREVWYRDPVDIVQAVHVQEVWPALLKIDERVKTGLHAAGYIAYEAAAAFEPALADVAPAHPVDDVPHLLWFGLYREPVELPAGIGVESAPMEELSPSLDRQVYCETVEAIRRNIEAGDTYQLNFTFPLRGTIAGSTLAWFYALCEAQQADHCAYVDTGAHTIISASPELFFSLEGGRLRVKPMKGTRPRGRWQAEDRALAQALLESDKDRAENLMIVDLLRNDLGRVGEVGSVEVERLFEVERYPTLWQMTSSIQSRTKASVPEILHALFPSGSVTGAPKIKTMQLINRYESYWRHAYCGSIGWWTPDGRAEFNVAIRTAIVEAETGAATYAIGSGITWDSDAEKEYDECVTKAAVLTHRLPEFQLVESLLHDGNYFLLDEHLKRLHDSADYFGFACNVDAVREAMFGEAWIANPDGQRRKVRVLLSRNGAINITSELISNSSDPGIKSPFEGGAGGCWVLVPEISDAEVNIPLFPPSKGDLMREPVPLRVGLAQTPVNSHDVFLFHKTTHRAVYDAAKQSRPDCDDVILSNERGELTESTRANLVVEIDGKRLTPPVECGLLAGTFRRHLLSQGEIEVGVITKEELQRATRLWLINSVRMWMLVRLVTLRED